MWYLECLNDTLIYFWDKDSYKVGRKNADIIIQNDDSISRDHGIFNIKNENLYLTDVGSKYGTYIQDEKLNVNEERLLLKDEIITFGLLKNDQSKFKVKKLEFKIIFSNIKSNDKHDLYNTLDFVKAVRCSDWDESCTHVVAGVVILTSKILCALTIGQAIVNTKYFKDCELAIKANNALPKTENYKPQFNETLVNKNMKLEFNESRKRLFKDKIFIFLTEKSKNNFNDVVRVAGGKAISWQKDAFDINNLKTNAANYIFIEESLESCNKDSKKYQSFQEGIKICQSIGRRPIPLQEIALAITYNSCMEYCNPLFNRVGLLIPKGTQGQNSEQILVYDTQYSKSSSSSSQTQSQSSECIPEVVEATLDTPASTNSKTNNSVKRSSEVLEDVDKPNKKAKENLSTTSTEFSFRRPSCQSTPQIKSTQSNISKFTFTTETNITVTNTETEINPFSRKRKANDNLQIDPKKRPLGNISNTISNKSNNKIIQQNDSSIKDTSKYQPWLSKQWIHAEASCNELIMEEPEDEEIKKLNEIFKDSVIIKVCSIELKKSKTLPLENSSDLTINFKKFKKNKNKVQTEIFTNVCTIVTGDSDSTSSSDEEDNDI